MEIYFEHKTDSYKNNKRKLSVVSGTSMRVLMPYQDGNSFGLTRATESKEVTEEVLLKFWKEIERGTFFEKEITHIPTP